MQEKKQLILRRLSEKGGYVSGQELCRMLGVSRTAVWKIIQKLKDEGYPIEAVTNRGYRLLSLEESDLFNQEQIARQLKTRWAGRPALYREETGSTNDDIFALAEQGYPHGTLAAASRQTSGKGRRGRRWLSPPDGNIYMSLLLKPDFPAEAAPVLTVVMALSAYEAAAEICSTPADAAGTPVAQAQAGTAAEGRSAPAPADAVRTPAPSPVRFGIKWPNDIVVTTDGETYRKVCGILTEMRLEDSEISAIAVGIGINVNQTELDPEIAGTASSIALASGRKINRAALAASVWNHFEKNYGIFEKTLDFSGLRPAYEAALVNRGRAVCVLDPREPYTGTAAGINDLGELLVRPDGGGPLRAVGSGEVSVRGVNGYV